MKKPERKGPVVDPCEGVQLSLVELLGGLAALAFTAIICTNGPWFSARWAEVHGWLNMLVRVSWQLLQGVWG